MPLPKINGSRGKIRQSQTVRFDPTNGQTISIEWAGAGSNLGGYANTLKNLGVPFEHTQSGVISTLTETASDYVALGTEEVVVTQRFDILYNEQMLDIKESPNWIALDPQQSVQVLKDVERFREGKSGVASGDWDSTDEWGADAITAEAYYYLMIQGLTHFPVDSWVLRHTFNIPGDTTQGRSGYYAGSIDTGIGAIYTTSQILSTIPTSYARIREKLASITLPAKSGYLVGWRKRPTGETTLGNNRIEVSAEYTFAQWAAIIYSAA
jgi:hypothetical protein